MVIETRTRTAADLRARTQVDRWVEYLSTPGLFGFRTVKAMRPCLTKMAARRGRRLTYRLAQVLFGHGCFGEYLCE